MKYGLKLFRLRKRFASDTDIKGTTEEDFIELPKKFFWEYGAIEKKWSYVEK